MPTACSRAHGARRAPSRTMWSGGRAWPWFGWCEMRGSGTSSIPRPRTRHRSASRRKPTWRLPSPHRACRTPSWRPSTSGRIGSYLRSSVPFPRGQYWMARTGRCPLQYVAAEDFCNRAELAIEVPDAASRWLGRGERADVAATLARATGWDVQYASVAVGDLPFGDGRETERIGRSSGQRCGQPNRYRCVA
jgi:hypothetical protein